MKTYLITGGTGFIGSHLVRRLVQQNERVHLIIENDANLWRIDDLSKNINVHEMSLADHQRVTNLVTAIRPDRILHLASYGGMPYESNQQLIYDVNFYGTMNLLNACKSFGFECFINTGSSSEYGKKQTAMHEDDVLAPVSDYAVAKAAATQFCLKEADRKSTRLNSSH